MKINIVGQDWFMHQLVHNLENIRMDNKMYNRILILDRLLEQGAITKKDYIKELDNIYRR